MNELRQLASHFGRQNAFVALVEIALALAAAGFIVGGIVEAWCASASLVVGMVAARKRWPRVRLKHYFTTGKVALPALLIAGGVGLQYVVAGVLPGASPIGGGVTGLVVGGLVAAACASVVMAIFEGKAMKSIFELVPIEQQPQLRDFVQGRSPATAGGQFADFTGLDPAVVTQAVESRVIGQNPIVESVVTTAFRRARLRRPQKPVAVFLFVGATGAGKTELAKALADALFQGRLIRVDCNELSRPEGVARLIGAPPGYIGSQQGGQLCRDIGRTGTGVLLFDEIEKADPGVMKVIMGLLDEARLTEQSTGTTYSATGFLIVLTSNAAAGEIAQVVAAQSDPQAQAGKVKDALKAAGFLPEVLARIDAVFPFGALPREAIVEIVGRFLMGFARDAGVELASVDSALLIDLVTKQEKLVGYGVREVVRLVENAVVDGLLSVKDRGYRRAAIRVVDGQVLVDGMRA